MHNYFLLQELRKQSFCKDKQVSCIITDSDGEILSVGYNKVISCGHCTANIKGKDNCTVIHAEEMALINLSNTAKSYTAYVSLYPCPECQRLLDYAGINEIVVYGTKHKECVINKDKIVLRPSLVHKLHKTNGEQKQLAVIISELAELQKAICDFFYRRHEREITIDDVLDEIVDVQLMSAVLTDVLTSNYDKTTMSKLFSIEESKLNKIELALERGIIKRGSPYSKSI